jgi:hypothetical protein
MVEHTDPKLRHEQAVGKLEGPGTPSHGQRQSQTIGESVPGTISVDRGRTEGARQVGGKVIGVPRKRVEVGSCGRTRKVGGEGRLRKL